MCDVHSVRTTWICFWFSTLSICVGTKTTTKLQPIQSLAASLQSLQLHTMQFNERSCTKRHIHQSPLPPHCTAPHRTEGDTKETSATGFRMCWRTMRSIHIDSLRCWVFGRLTNAQGLDASGGDGDKRPEAQRKPANGKSTQTLQS